jgi:hypothetical protein
VPVYQITLSYPISSLFGYSNWAIDWTYDGLWFDYRKGQGIYLFFKPTRPILGPIEPPIQRVPGVLFPDYKTVGAGSLNTSNVEIKSERSYTSSPPLHQCFHCLHRDNFAFTIHTTLYRYFKTGHERSKIYQPQ